MSGVRTSHTVSYIGWTLILTTGLFAQTPGRLLQFRDDSPTIRRIVEPLGATASTRWAAGWASARALGPAAAPALYRHFERQRRDSIRFRLFGAWALAVGRGELVDRIAGGDWLARADRGLRTFACLVFGLTGEAELEGTAFAKVLLRRGSVGERVAAGLALWRCSRRTPLPARRLQAAAGDDPGLLAVAALCGLDSELEDSRVPERFRTLVERARFLGRPGRDPAPRRMSATRALADRSAEPELQRAAAAWLARHGRLDTWRELPEVSPEVLTVLAATPAPRSEWVRRGWLVAKPSELISAPLRQALAVDYVLAADPRALIKPGVVFGGDNSGAVQLAMALRTLGVPGPGQVAVSGDAFGRSVANGMGERAPVWLRAVLGQSVRGDQLRVRGFAELDGLGPAVAAGEMRRSALADHLERALWRVASHPRHALWRTERELIRDLLLAGSRYAKARSGSGRKRRYFPSGLTPELHASAYEFYEFTGTASPLPPEHRLRR